MKIALVRPPILGSETRGVGFYYRRLLSALKKGGVSVDELELDKYARLGEEFDLAHFTYFDPFFLTLPLKKNLPVVVTVHDLVPLVFPDKFPRGIKGELKWQIQKLSLKGVGAVITDSENSKKDIVDLTGVAASKVYVVPLAADGVFRPIRSTTTLHRVEVKYQLPDKFILYVGDVNWNKNVNGLLHAFAQMQNAKCKMQNDNEKLKVKLVLVGKAFLDKRLPEIKEIDSLMKKLGLQEHVLRLGFVPTKDLAGIYNLASVYVQPSFYEGFGLPVLEAMASGCPVVCPKTSSLPEVAGQAAIYVGTNPKSIAMGVKKVLEMTQTERLILQKKTMKQAKKFSWEKTAMQTIEVYKRVVSNEVTSDGA